MICSAESERDKTRVEEATWLHLRILHPDSLKNERRAPDRGRRVPGKKRLDDDYGIPRRPPSLDSTQRQNPDGSKQ